MSSKKRKTADIQVDIGESKWQSSPTGISSSNQQSILEIPGDVDIGESKWQEDSATRIVIISSSNQQSILDLPGHVKMEILIKLPIKALIKCRCVCKTWKSILSDPYFIKLQLSRTPMNLLYRTLPEQNRSKQLHLIDLRDAPKKYCSGDSKLKLTMKANLPPNGNVAMTVLNSCNGLLCLGHCFTDEPLYVCNPILGEYIVLPKPRKDLKCIGGIFGFCSETNHYKVVRNILPSNSHSYSYDNPFETEIYTLGEGKWRSIGNAPYRFGSSTPFNTVVNGSLHWVAFGGNDFIRSFHFGTEQFRVIPAPAVYGPTENMTKDCLRLGVLNDSLYILSNGRDSMLDIWVMNDYGVQDSWSKKYVIENLICERDVMNYFEPIMVMDSGELLIIFNESSVLLYSPHTERFELAYEVRSSTFQAIAHVPSFLSLKDVAKGEILKVCRA